MACLNIKLKGQSGFVTKVRPFPRSIVLRHHANTFDTANSSSPRLRTSFLLNPAASASLRLLYFPPCCLLSAERIADGVINSSDNDPLSVNALRQNGTPLTRVGKYCRPAKRSLKDTNRRQHEPRSDLDKRRLRRPIGL